MVSKNTKSIAARLSDETTEALYLLITKANERRISQGLPFHTVSSFVAQICDDYVKYARSKGLLPSKNAGVTPQNSEKDENTGVTLRSGDTNV